MLITNLANNGYRPVISIVQSAPLMLIIRTLTLIDFRISGPVGVSARVQVAPEFQTFWNRIWRSILKVIAIKRCGFGTLLSIRNLPRLYIYILFKTIQEGKSKINVLFTTETLAKSTRGENNQHKC